MKNKTAYLASWKHVLRWPTARFAVGLALGMSMLLAFSSSALAARDYYKIGVVTSLSGDYALGGDLTKRGYDTWARAVNAKGGIKVAGKRYKVKLVYADAQSNPKSGADAASRMIQSEKVDFIFGPYSSAVTLGVAPIAEKYQVPMVTGSAESPEIWQHHFNFTFGTIPSVDMTAQAPIKYLTEQSPKPKSIAVIGINDPFSKAAATGFEKAAKQQGLKVLSFDVVPTHSDFSALLSKIKDENPDILAVGGEPQDLIDVLKAAASINFSPKAIVMHYGITDAGFRKEVGSTFGNYTIGLTDWSKDADLKDNLFGTAAEYDKAFRKHYNLSPDYTTAACSATGEAFTAALQKIGAKPPLSRAERLKLMKALEGIDIQTFYGAVNFAKSGPHFHDNVELKPMVVQVVAGEQYIVSPQKYKQHKLVYPRPSFADILK